MQRTKITQLLKRTEPAEIVLVQGWVRTRRDAKGFSFIELNDGSCLANIQIIADQALPNYDELIHQVTTGTALTVQGRLVSSQGKGQQWELRSTAIAVLGSAPEDFPLQKKRHSDEYLRTIAHLRPRTNKYSAVFRIRSELAFAVHQFFHERDFRYVHTPILTASDCEGAGEMFRVTTLPPGKTSVADDFFGTEANLTVSGQLEAEMLALSLGDVYTFGPTFRAENSNTRRHAAEFWMVEPEMAFCDLEQNVAMAETLIRYLTNHALTHCSADIDLFARFVDKDLMKKLDLLVSSEFVRIPYKEALAQLEHSGHAFEYPVSYGQDLQSEHERYLTERVFKRPVFVYDFPESIKPFYMRLNDDQETVASMDLLVPEIGEIIGGSQREERYDVLVRRMETMGLSKDNYWWYLQSRHYGSVPHSGFGLGFERLIMLITGISNIRDVIPFPRTPKNISF